MFQQNTSKFAMFLILGNFVFLSYECPNLCRHWPQGIHKVNMQKVIHEIKTRKNYMGFLRRVVVEHFVERKKPYISEECIRTLINRKLLLTFYRDALCISSGRSCSWNDNFGCYCIYHGLFPNPYG